jgi:hypothetical protein
VYLLEPQEYKAKNPLEIASPQPTISSICSSFDPMVESFKALSYKPGMNLFPQKTVGDVFLISVILCKLTVFARGLL